MKEWTEKEINAILALKGNDEEPIDIFDLYGVLHIGNCLDENTINPKTGRIETKSMWNITRRFNKFSSNTLGIKLDDFDGCETEEDVHERFSELLEQAVCDRLV